MRFTVNWTDVKCAECVAACRDRTSQYQAFLPDLPKFNLHIKKCGEGTCVSSSYTETLRAKDQTRKKGFELLNSVQTIRRRALACEIKDAPIDRQTWSFRLQFTPYGNLARIVAYGFMFFLSLCPQGHI